jgi:hypothetical protein
MITDPIELTAQRDLTDYFIKADPITVILWRRGRVSNGQGGFILSAAAGQAPQTFKLIPQSSSRQLERQTAEGVVVQPSHVLMGYWNANVLPGDYFLFDGYRYDIVFVHEKNDFETISEVVFRGKPS